MLRFSVSHSPFILIFSVFIVLFSVLWSFRFLRRDFYPRKIRKIIVVLRSLALLCLLPILLDLEISLTRNVEQAPLYAFIWDFSASMQNPDNSPFTAAQLLNTKEYRSLRKKIRIEHISGMEKPALLQESELRRKKSDEPISDLGKLLRFAEKEAKYQAIVLISDGQSYLGELLSDFKLSSGIPIHCIGVGDSLQDGQILLSSLGHPAFITEKDSLPLLLNFENPSESEMKGTVSILLENDTLFQESLELQSRSYRELPALLPGLPAGNNKLSIYFEGDHLAVRALKIFPSHIRIVCDSREADPDIAMINTVLSAKENYRTYNYDSWLKRFPGEKPDLLIQIWHPQEEQLFFEDVPAILFYRESGADYRLGGEFRIVEQRPYLFFDRDPELNHFYWKQLPPLYILDYPAKGKVLLESAEGRAIILEDKSQRCIIISASGLWRWQLSGYEKGWEGLYRHLIQTMLPELLKSGKGHFISFDRDEYHALQYSSFAAITRSQNLPDSQMEEAQISVSLHDRNFAELQRREHNYLSSTQSYFMPGDTGQYYLMARLFIKDRLMESDTAGLQVLYHDPETHYRGCNAEALKSLSSRHGGFYFPLGELDSLEILLPAEKERQSVSGVFQARRAYMVMIILLVFLGTEWILRKRYGSV